MARIRTEYSKPVFWALFVCLWSLAVIAVLVVLANRSHLQLWKIGLYFVLLGGYLIAERIAHRTPQQLGDRAHESLRYWLALTWWALVFGSILVYALHPVEKWALTLTGALIVLAGSILRVWSVFTLGRFYSGHIETWAGQTIVQTGPYHILRHPGYAGSILQGIGFPLLVNAYPVLILSLVALILFVYRMLWEERWLTENLPGYQEYCSRTRRLIPGVW